MDIQQKRDFNKQLLALAIPLALQHLLNALVGATDALMLGRLTQDAVAAVSLANQISFVMSLFNGSIIGAAGILIAQYFGKKDYEKAKSFLGMAVRYTGVISVVFAVITLLFPTYLMEIFTNEEALISIGSDYLKIVGFSYLFMGISQCFLMMMKISGFAKMSVIISAVTVITDVIADLFLIYGYAGFDGFGANGSAYSTVVVEAIALIWCLVWMLKEKNIKIKFSHISVFSKLLEWDMWKIVPGMLASSLCWGLSMTMHSFILGHLGTDATAAASVTIVAQQLIQCLTHGLSSGASIMIGQKLGKNQLEDAKRYGARFWKVSAISGMINVVLIAIAGFFVYTFYVLEPKAKEYLIGMLIMSAFYMFAYAYNTIITCGVFPAGGDSKYDAISVLLATWCFAIPLSLLGCFLLDWSVMTVYVVMCLDEIVKVPFIKKRYNKYIWLKNLTI